MTRSARGQQSTPLLLDATERSSLVLLNAERHCDIAAWLHATLLLLNHDTAPLRLFYVSQLASYSHVSCYAYSALAAILSYSHSSECFSVTSREDEATRLGRQVQANHENVQHMRKACVKHHDFVRMATVRRLAFECLYLHLLYAHSHCPFLAMTLHRLPPALVHGLIIPHGACVSDRAMTRGTACQLC